MSETPSDQIQLLQCFVCREFKAQSRDGYVAEHVQSNLYVKAYPHHFESMYLVTCWRKDSMFHKEVIEYATDDGQTIRSPHMDVEPVTDSVLFRWHKHRFPRNFPIRKNTHLTIRVILDGKIHFETYILIEKRA